MTTKVRSLEHFSNDSKPNGILTINVLMTTQVFICYLGEDEHNPKEWMRKSWSKKQSVMGSYKV